MTPLEFNADSAWYNLVAQCEFGPRNPGSAGHTACRIWLKDRLGNFTDEVYVQPFTATEAVTKQERRLYNIIARFPGSGTTPLMLCAHWDTRAIADLDPDLNKRSEPILGANDGASGVAVLMELARIFADYPPPREVWVVLFDGEDMGRSSFSEEFALGSKYWASNMLPGKPAEAILLDMIGDANLEIYKEGYSLRSAPALVAHLWNIAQHLSLDAFIDEVGPVVFDDHVRLQRMGIKAINLIDFDYPYWHTLQDTPENCSAESLSQVGRLLLNYIYGIKSR